MLLWSTELLLQKNRFLFSELKLKSGTSLPFNPRKQSDTHRPPAAHQHVRSPCWFPWCSVSNKRRLSALTMIVLTLILVGFLSARSLLPAYRKINQISFPHDLFFCLQSLQSISILLLNLIFTSKFSELYTSPDLNALFLQRRKFPWDSSFSYPRNAATASHLLTV